MKYSIKFYGAVLFITSIYALTGCNQIKKNTAITSNELYKHIGYLASDELKGRYPGTYENELAANYIHKQFSVYGLNPEIKGGFQTFEVVTDCSLGPNNHLIILNDSVKLHEEYCPVGFSGNAKVNGTVTFVGYGFEIETDSLNWNDYAVANVKGTWAMILREDPEPENMESEFIPFSGDRSKVTLAKDKGAVGVLLVNGVNASKKDKPIELAYDQNLSNAGIPVLSITRKIADKILDETGKIVNLEEQIIKEKKSIVITTKTIIDANVNVIQNRATARNVVFSINSGSESDNYIVIGAHYDHLGMGGSNANSRMPDTTAVHNGADDNASGVAGIIELAGYLASKADTLKKNFLFAAFDGEEMGLLGSKYFINNMPIKKENITAMLNFDMIGRMKHDTIGITIGGTGTALEFDSILNFTDAAFNKVFSPDGYGPSDHAPFYSNNIPVLFFSTGAHEDYHTPFDDIEKLDLERETDILKYASEIALNLASNSDTLTFQSTGNPQQGGRRTRLKVTLGIIPDFSGMQKNGLGIDGVRKGGPAEKGGMLKGDKITSINGDPVTNIYDYMFRLSKLKPETTAIIEIERNNKKEILLIQL